MDQIKKDLRDCVKRTCLLTRVYMYVLCTFLFAVTVTSCACNSFIMDSESDDQMLIDSMPHDDILLTLYENENNNEI